MWTKNMININESLLVAQPSGPGWIPGMSCSDSAITRGETDRAAATYLVFVN